MSEHNKQNLTQTNVNKKGQASQAPVEAQANGATDVAEVATPKNAKLTAAQKEEISRCFKEYFVLEAEESTLEAKLLENKRKRSAVAKKINDASPKRSFTITDQHNRIMILMNRQDVNKDSPTHGETFYFFRSPGHTDSEII